MLMTNDVCRVLKLPRMTLHQWIASGAVVPTEPGGIGRGRGYSLLFSPVQVVGLAYALALRELRCPRDWAVKAARFVATQTPGELRRAFAEGRTLAAVSPVPGEGRLVRPADPATRYDLEKVYGQVVRALREAAGRADEAGETQAARRLGDAADELSGACAPHGKDGRRPFGGAANGRRVVRRSQTVG